jgi:uncharacterized protein (DUF2267 family)
MHDQNLFDATVRKSEAWVDDLAQPLGWYSAKTALRALRILLHAWRDRLPLHESAQFAAQMPMLIRGIYYENWRPVETPDSDVDRATLLRELNQAFPDTDSAAICQAFGQLLAKHVTAGEIDDVRAALPKGLRELCDVPRPVSPA